MRIKTLYHIFTILFLSAVLACCNSKSVDFINRKEVGTLLWVNDSMSDSIVKLAVKETLENSTLIVSQISWSPLDTSFVNNVQWYHTLAVESGKPLMLNVDWLDNNRSGTRDDFNFENKKTKALFIQDMKHLVDLYHPEYIALGVEVNYYALTSPLGFKEFINVFNELKNYFKEKEPRIKVGLTYQLELLFGVHKDWGQNKTLEPLNAVAENLDYIGISTYPDMIIHSTNLTSYSINYLDSLVTIYKKPFGISETGISAINYNNTDRIEYINAIYKKAEDLNLRFMIWGSIIDHPSQGDWKTKLGLINSDGINKPEYNIWKQQNEKFINN